MAKHAHELEAAGEVRWTGKMKNGLLMITDQASGEEHQSPAYTLEGSAVRFSLPGDNGLRVLTEGQPGYDALRTVVEKALGGPSEADAAPAAAPAKAKTS